MITFGISLIRNLVIILFCFGKLKNTSLIYKTFAISERFATLGGLWFFKLLMLGFTPLHLTHKLLPIPYSLKTALGATSL